MDRRFWGILGLLGVILLLVILLVNHREFTSTTNQAQPNLTNGLIVYWTSNGTGMYVNMPNDRSGYGHNGTSPNGLPTAGGNMEQPVEFHGGTDYVDLGSDFISTKVITISAWVYARSRGGQGCGRILDNGSTVLKIPNAARFTFSSDGLVTEASSESGSFELNTWTHVVVTRNNRGFTNFYINGTLSGMANQKSGKPVTGFGHVRIGNGASDQQTDVGWDGLIDEVRIYNRVLMIEEIRGLYNMDNRGTGSLSSIPFLWFALL
jgi:hypothetical protein